MPKPEVEKLRVWAEVDRDALRANVAFTRSRIGPGAGIMAVVKADAYGHGVRGVVPAIREGVEVFAVANVDEAAGVREVEGGRDVLLLSPCLPAERADAVEGGFIATVSGLAEAEAFARLAAGRPARIQFKIDTGMGRVGAWHESALDELRAVAGLPGIELHSVSTHLPVADEDEDFTRGQLALFEPMARRIREIAPGAKIHVLNSAGVCAFPEAAYDLVRAGLMLYGSIPLGRFQPLLAPALTWKTRVALVRDLPAGRGISYGRTFITPRPMRVATLAAGYADGYPRQVSNRGACVLVGGKRCPLLGRVTMDQIMVDVSAAPEAAVGGVATLIGADGGETILAEELAGWAGTIAWDIFTGIGGRSRRVFR